MLPDRVAVAQDGQLRDAAGLQEFGGLGGRGLRADGHERARPASPEQVADRLGGGLAAVQLVLRQPGVVVKLAQIIAPCIRAECDDDVVGREALGVAQGGRHGRTRGTADQKPLSPRHRPGRMKALGVADPDPLVDDLAIQCLGDEILTDPLDFPWLGSVAREDRALRVGTDDLDLGISLFQVPAHARDGAAGPDPGDESRYLAAGLFPDLGAGRTVVDLGVGQVGELVGPPGPGDLACEPLGDAVITLGRVGRNGSRRDHDLRAVGFEQAGSSRHSSCPAGRRCIGTL